LTQMVLLQIRPSIVWRSKQQWRKLGDPGPRLGYPANVRKGSNPDGRFGWNADSR
jgi:hypothetical protein